jgi:probable F420-dependent oxidoreductase
MDLGRIGIWTFQLDLVPANRATELVAELEELGFGAVWVPEAVSREAFTNAALLLRGGNDIVVATGIASIYGRDPMTAAAAHKTVCEAYPGRFLLGLGVSHAPMVEGIRGHDYSKPYSAMKDYLDKMDSALFIGVEPSEPSARALAALGPKMLQLAADRTLGAHSYFVPPEHTAVARETMGPDALLAVELAVVLEPDPSRAREIAKNHTQIYTPLPNYTNNLRRFGFGDDDFVGAGSDRLIDAIVACGDIDTVAERVRAHHDAGADHVCIQVIQDLGPPPVDAWRELAAILDA